MMEARKQLKAKEAAQEAVTREFNEDEDHSNLSLDPIGGTGARLAVMRKSLGHVQLESTNHAVMEM